MLKKSLATFVALLLALGLSLAASPAFASPAASAGGGGGGGGGGWSGGGGGGGGGGGWTPPATTTYGVALYVYKKVDPTKPASWGNSGPQRLVLQDVDNTSKDANPWFSSLDAALLPSDVCGPGWAVQQDKVSFTGSFSFPSTITPPVDNIGWPPLYDAKHSELSSLVTVPLCAGASAAVTITPATCSAPASIALGAVTHASWGALSRSVGPGAYSVVATAESGYRFDDGGTTKTFSGTLAGRLSADDPSCAPPPSCIPKSAVSYTYDPATNSGVITVAAPARSTGVLCSPFWVTATSWKYLGTSTWIQKLDQVQKLGQISTPGTYPYSAPVTCGQGDIYASFHGDAATLDPTPYLYGPDNPFDEHFLHEMGFSGPKPSYMTTQTGCNEVTAEPSSTPPTCTGDGQFTLPAVEHVRWYRDGAELAPGTYPVAAGGTATITAIADESWVLQGGTQDTKTHEWSLRWVLDFPAPSCAAPRLVGELTAQCVNDVPMLHYSVTLLDPDHQSTGDVATLSLSDGTNTYVYDPSLGTIHDGETLTGDRLWPGASVDSGGSPTGWPGWEFDGTTWVPTSGNFAWSRASGLTATISVNPQLTTTVSYPPGDPACAPGPRVVTPDLDWSDLVCDAEVGGSYSLPLIDGVSWWVDGVETAADTYTVHEPGTVHVEAVPDQAGGPVRFADGAQTEWDLVFSAPEECLTLGGSTVTGTCEADSPWIDYTVQLTDPYDQTTSREAKLVMVSGLDSVTIDLGTIPDDGILTGRVLWPGASVDPGTGEANGWPGWELVGGAWQPTTGNYAWTRSITEATLEVNPSMVVALSYPPASPNCLTSPPPPNDPPTLGLFPTSAVLSTQCTSDGRGILTLGQVDGVSFFEDVNYFVDGVPATSSTVYLSAGTYQVTVTTKNASDGLDGPTAWRVVVTGGNVCGELTTLALSGVDSGSLLALAGVLIAAGAAVAITRRLRLRRPA
ncbi:hypothetical protein [Protaetiibacter mangrovi]|uniref:Ig-like domain-containing protein n=1 Tax=Protaetiibacter mangrovi TaxID=2970926 RepID=A0ABT1ZCD2_9MICO|nr:hypothetical protein [Protaetiibacter mangrovi]MCS0498363.1 hypothetical protein [Protaetiibacter mangrovi]